VPLTLSFETLLPQQCVNILLYLSLSFWLLPLCFLCRFWILGHWAHFRCFPCLVSSYTFSLVNLDISSWLLNMKSLSPLKPTPPSVLLISILQTKPWGHLWSLVSLPQQDSHWILSAPPWKYKKNLNFFHHLFICMLAQDSQLAFLLLCYNLVSSQSHNFLKYVVACLA
jgi:hypothetical protein